MPRAQPDSTTAQVVAALDRVADPCSIATGVPVGLGEMGLVQGVHVDGDVVRITLRLTSPICWQAAHMVAAAKEQVLGVDGIREVEVDVDSEGDWMPEMMSVEARARLRRVRPVNRARGRTETTRRFR